MGTQGTLSYVGGGAAATPTFSIAGGTYNTVQSPVVSSTTPSSTIHCTIDGSTATSSSPTSVPIAEGTVSCGSALLAVTSGRNNQTALSPFTIHAVATAPGFTPSAMASATYTLQVGQDGLAGTAIGSPTGTATHTCASDLTTTGTYFLDADMTCSGVAFLIDADNITLNLNGHTITYNTAGSGNAKGTPGIGLIDSFYTGYMVAGTTSRHGNFNLCCGTITESSGSHAKSPPVGIGQASDWNGFNMSHVVLNSVTEDSADLLIEDQSAPNVGGITVQNNQFSMANAVTSNRDEYFGYAIQFQGGVNLANSLTNNIVHNSFVAATQGAIDPVYQHSIIEYNDITYNSSTTNDFGIINNGAFQTISYNYLHPVNGRGIHVITNNSTVSFNNIYAHTTNDNPEYGGCPLGGVYGIQMEYDNTVTSVEPTAWLIADNSINAVADVCAASAFRLTGMSSASSGIIANNTGIGHYTGTGGAHDYAINEDGEVTPAAGITWTTNYFSSDWAYALADVDGAAGTISSGQTWANTPSFIFENKEFPQAGDPSGTAHTWTISDTVSTTIPVATCTESTNLLTTVVGARSSGPCP